MAESYLNRRRLQCTSWRDEKSFETPTGDAHFLSFSVTELEGVSSVRVAFDRTRQFFRDLEIRISDQLGFITIREDEDEDDDADNAVPQNRFISTAPCGFEIESNSVIFSHYQPTGQFEGGERGFGLIVVDFIDADDRYLNAPATRVRRDHTNVVEFTSFVRPIDENTPGSPQREEVVVKMTQCLYAKLHFPKFHLSRAVWKRIQETSEQWAKLFDPSTM